MDKLIELLEKYLNINGNDITDLKHLNNSFQNDNALFSDELVISKRFGFIKRLVDNDKIDYRNLVYLFLPDYAKFIEDSEYFGTYESLLIKLALSDTPIQDLISLLK